MTSFPQIPIAMFHHVSDRTDLNSLRPFVVLKRTFVRFLDSIQHSGFRAVTFEQISRPDFRQTKKDVIITFDDCGKHLMDFALSELIRREMKAVFFMPTAYIGGANQWNIDKGQSKLELMDEADLVSLQQSEMEIGGHSHHHIHLDHCKPARVNDEIFQCQMTLKEILGKPAVSFAYPFGGVPENSAQILDAHDFKFGCSIFSPSCGNYQLRRFIVHDGDTTLTMRMKLSKAYQFYRRATDHTR
jgi:peptidoglycan/xylan/chitin deacetylase (PgdA/CDA1 family)